MFKMKFIIAIIAIASMSSMAIAGPYAPYNKRFGPPPAAYSSWNGVYMGAHGGYGWGDSDIKENLPAFGFGILPANISSSFNTDGGLGGVHLGMNAQFDHVVIGGELRLSGAGIDGSTRNCFRLASVANGLGAPPGTVDVQCDTNVNWVAATLAKLGYASHSWLVYGTLGWAVAGVDHRFAVNIAPGLLTPGAINLASAENDTADGFAFGGGVEYALSHNVSLGVEYTRMNLKSEGSGLILGGALTTGDRDIDLNTVTGRLNFKFGASWGG